MELTKLERECEKMVAETHGGLSLALFATAVLIYTSTDSPWWIAGVILGILFALSTIILIFLKTRVPKKVVKTLLELRIKYLAWFFGVFALGVSLLQGKYIIPGVISLVVAYIILGAGIGANLGTLKKRKRNRESKKGSPL